MIEISENSKSWQEIAYIFAHDVLAQETAISYALWGYAHTLLESEKSRVKSASYTNIPLDQIKPISHLYSTCETLTGERVFHSIHGETLIDYLKLGGLGTQMLSKMFVASIFSLWEVEYRPLIADKLKAGSGDIKVPLFGDLTKIRNFVLHSSRADARVAGCKILNWFESGDSPVLHARHVGQLGVLINSFCMNLSKLSEQDGVHAVFECGQADNLKPTEILLGIIC